MAEYYAIFFAGLFTDVWNRSDGKYLKMRQCETRGFVGRRYNLIGGFPQSSPRIFRCVILLIITNSYKTKHGFDSHALPPFYSLNSHFLRINS